MVAFEIFPSSPLLYFFFFYGHPCRNLSRTPTLVHPHCWCPHADHPRPPESAWLASASSRLGLALASSLALACLLEMAVLAESSAVSHDCRAWSSLVKTHCTRSLDRKRLNIKYDIQLLFFLQLLKEQRHVKCFFLGTFRELLGRC